ncbi:hypothetical protein FRC08_004898 [Ceratobasidium sp. 394]|nr:hypothetical protein FRC08_004898 [Ceratobasidium sp. 394]
MAPKSAASYMTTSTRPRPRLTGPHQKEPPRRRPSTAPPTSLPASKRQKTSLHEPATLPHQDVQDAGVVTPPASALSLADTPLRTSSSSRPQSRPTQSQHSSRNQPMIATLSPEVAEEANQRTKSLERDTMGREDMEAILREEINLAVYEYRDFVDEFLPVPETRRGAICRELNRNLLFSYNNTPWTIDCRTLEGPESETMHDTVASILDFISQAAFSPDEFRPVHQNVVPLHGKQVKADDPNDTAAIPDLIQAMRGPDGSCHWAEVNFFAECKAASEKKGNDEQLSEALSQLARYARSTLIHQVYRLHVFSIAICNTKAVFVRLGRDGILHSPQFDLRNDFERFAMAAAGLFALDSESFGYDPRFYFWPRLTGQSDNYETRRDLRVKTGKKRWTVLEIICQRKCLVGRATLVLRLARIKDRQMRAVLKSIHRYGTRPDEGDNLASFKNFHGICQRRWAEFGGSTAVMNTDPDALVASPLMKSFYPPLSEEEADRIRSSNSDASARSLRSKVTHAKYKQRRLAPPEYRVHSMILILMDEGVPLWRIKRLPHLLRVLRDGVVGLAKIVELGKVHRDISEGNVLCTPLRSSPSGDEDDPWSDQPTYDATSDLDTDSDDSDVTNVTSTFDQNSDGRSDTTDDSELNVLPLNPETGIIHAETYDQYVKQRYNSLKCDGRVYDLEFMVDQNRPDDEARGTERTGTPAFISAQLLLATELDPVQHTFLHDLESIFWVLIWTVATHTQPGRQLNEQAQSLINKLCDRNDQSLGHFKKGFIGYPQDVRENIRRLDNDWKKAASVAEKFASFLRRRIYEKPNDQNTSSEDEKVVSEHCSETAGSDVKPWTQFKTVIDIFDHHISKLR